METKHIRIVCMHGGRRDGSTSRLLSAMAGGCCRLRETHPAWGPWYIDMSFYGLADPEYEIPILTDPETQQPYGTVSYLLGAVREADGLLLATPVRWHNMSALMMRLLEWFYFLEAEAGWPLEGLPVGYGAHGQIDGGQAAINAMQSVMTHLKCATPSDCHFYIIESLMRHAASDRELGWMTTDAPLVGLRVAEAAAMRRYGLRP